MLNSYVTDAASVTWHCGFGSAIPGAKEHVTVCAYGGDGGGGVAAVGHGMLAANASASGMLRNAFLVLPTRLAMFALEPSVIADPI
jgi:hypothetical protein